MRKLHQLAVIFTSTGLGNLFRIARPFFKNEVPILTYHRVINVEQNYPFDSDLISATPKTFKQQMEYIKLNYHPISMAEFINAIENNTRLPKNSIMVTFDDGFEDNYTNAYPVLKKLSIPATFFVTTSYIGQSGTIWYERLAYFFNKNTVEKITVKELSLEFNLTKTNRQECYQELIEALKLIDDSKREMILNTLYSEYGNPYLDISAQDKKLSQFMTWEQLHELSQNNITINAHSHTHPILSMLTREQLNFELSEPKKLIEEKLNSVVESIAYPVGQEDSISDTIRRETLNNKYKVGFSFISGMCDLNNLDKFNIKRLHVDQDYPFPIFKSMLSFPNIFAE